MFLAYCRVSVCVSLRFKAPHFLLFPASKPSNEEQRFPVPFSSLFIQGTLSLRRNNYVPGEFKYSKQELYNVCVTNSLI